MTGSTERFAEIQYQILGAMRNMFTTSMGAVVVMQDQGEKILRLLTKKGAETQQVRLKVVEEWISNLRKAQAEFKKAVEENFKRAEGFVSRSKGE